MKRLLVFSAGLLLALPAVAGRDRVKKDTLIRDIAFTDPAAPGKIIVDNVFGSVTVKAGAGGGVHLKAEWSMDAETDEDLARALKEIHLDVTGAGNEVKIIVDGPFRREDGSAHFRNRDEGGYSFVYDIEIEAPKNAAVDLRTIDDGDITVTGMTGDFLAENINGAVILENVSGSGKAGTLNDKLTVSFDRNPERPCTFHSLNGEMRIAFRSPLSADLRFKTFNGEVYSDFPVSCLPGKGLVEAGSKRGKHFYKTDKWTSVRIGDGGPSIDLDGFNGDTYILKRD